MNQHSTGRPDARKTRASRAFRKARSRAEDYVRSPDKLVGLVNEATQKARRRQGPLKELWASVTACFRLIKAYANGSYREIPWQSLVMIVASIVYFVAPLDLVPDFLAGLGYLDDAALLGWTLRTFAAEIEAFEQWEREGTA